MTRAELILYATPAGRLAAAIDDAFDRIATSGPTTAQTYPPHCTLTGFFHRDPDEIERIAAEVAFALADAPEGPVTIVDLHRRPEWTGLELQSPWLHSVVERFVALHRLGPGDDPLRPKDWLHLSLAYGIDDLGPANAALGDLDTGLSVVWDVALWQRHPNGAWSRLAN